MRRSWYSKERIEILPSVWRFDWVVGEWMIITSHVKWAMVTYEAMSCFNNVGNSPCQWIIKYLPRRSRCTHRNQNLLSPYGDIGDWTEGVRRNNCIILNILVNKVGYLQVVLAIRVILVTFLQCQIKIKRRWFRGEYSNNQ